MTRRETIFQAVLTALNTIPNLTVLRHPTFGHLTSLGMVAVVRPESDVPAPRKNDQQDHEFTIAVTLLSHGQNAEADADAFAAAIHEKITATPFLGGALSIAAGPVRFRVEESDAVVSSNIQSLFAISYRCHHTSLT